MPEITHLLETALYFDDLDAGVAFYREVIGLRVLDESPRLVAMDAGLSTVLLLFQRGATTAGANTPGGRIPPHDGSGPVHIAFAIPQGSIAAWEQHLNDSHVTIESRVNWPRGGQSLYLRDPAGHSIEIATPGLWATY